MTRKPSSGICTRMRIAGRMLCITSKLIVGFQYAATRYTQISDKNVRVVLTHYVQRGRAVGNYTPDFPVGQKLD